jgi:hypothetical protein
MPTSNCKALLMATKTNWARSVERRKTVKGKGVTR